MLKLYKIPGAYVFGFLGHFGSGKSISLIEQGVMTANQFRRGLAANFEINRVALRRYADVLGYSWFARCGIVKCGLSVESLLNLEGYVLLLDEAGLEIFARNFSNAQHQLYLDRLFRIRHYRNILFYAAQHFEQIDKQFRLCTHTWIYCSSFQPFSHRCNYHVLKSRTYFAFDSQAFIEWYNSPEKRNKFIYPMWLSKFRFIYRNLLFSRIWCRLIGVVSFLFYLCKYVYVRGFNHNFDIVFLEWLKYFYRPINEELIFKCFDSFDRFSKGRDGPLLRFVEYQDEGGLTAS